MRIKPADTPSPARTPRFHADRDRVSQKQAINALEDRRKTDGLGGLAGTFCCLELAVSQSGRLERTRLRCDPRGSVNNLFASA